MKAFLLAAGEGTRLRPITDSIPKCLVPIAGKPLLAIWLELCARHNIDEVLVNTHAHAGAVRDFVERWISPPRIVLSEEKELLGSAGTLAANREWVAGESDFCILYGDVLTNVDLGTMATYHRSGNYAATVGVYRVANPTECGIVDIDADQVIRGFEEKPAKPRSDLAFNGVLIASPEFLASVPDSVPADVGFHVLPKLMGKMRAFSAGEYLLDIGTLSKYERAQREWPAIGGIYSRELR